MAHVKLCEGCVARYLRSNSPAFAPRRKVLHSSVVKATIGPSSVVELRTSTLLSIRATSTHVLASHRADFRHWGAPLPESRSIWGVLSSTGGLLVPKATNVAKYSRTFQQM
jgi:hypothetical protein